MDEPTVETVATSAENGSVTIRITGEMRDAARRPLVRVVTDLLLAHGELRRLRLDLRPVTFVNSQGLAALVQVERMAAPRGITIELELDDRAVARPLQLAGLWSRFTVIDHRDDEEATPGS